MEHEHYIMLSNLSVFQIILTEDLKWWSPIVKISTNIIHIFLSEFIDSKSIQRITKTQCGII